MASCVGSPSISSTRFPATGSVAVETNVTSTGTLPLDIPLPERGRRRIGISVILALASLLLIATAGLLPRPAFGQAFVNGSITVYVTDATGAVIPNAQLSLTNINTGHAQNQKSDSSGFGRFVDLPPGTYKLTVDHAGFKHLSRNAIEVTVNASLKLQAVMQVGSATERIEVNAETPLLQPETSSLGQVIGERETNELPLNGRDPIALVELVPGVVPQAGFGQSPVAQNSFAPGNFQIDGGTANQSAAYWDGIPMNATGYANELAIVPTQDALQEFKVMTNNLPAEYGRFSGGIVSFITKSGSDQLHGEAYEYLRNKVLNANNFFDNRENIPTPQFTQNQFGANLGGPVRRDKTFFFASYDGFRLRQGQPYLVTVPTLAERSGDFSNLRNAKGALIPIYDPLTTQPSPKGGYTRKQFPNNIIPPGRIDPTARALLSFWPVPNQPGSPYTNAQNWGANSSAGGNLDEVIGRIDENLSARQRLFGRYSYENWSKLPSNAFGTGVVIDNGQGINVNTNQQIALDDTATFTPHLVGDFEVGFLRTLLSVVPQRKVDLSTLGPNWAPLASQVTSACPPAVNLSQVAGWGMPSCAIIRAITNDYDIIPNFTWIKGRNTFKYGGEYRLSQLNYGQGGGLSGTFTFTPSFTAPSPTTAGGFDLASFMLGYPASGSITSINLVAAEKYYWGAYFEDNLQIIPKLMLNLGVRYSVDSAFTERHNRISTFLRDAPNPLSDETGLHISGDLVLVDTPQRPQRTGFNTPKNDFAPRVGFSYQATRNIVVRGAYGVFWIPNVLSYSAVLPTANQVNQYSTTMKATLNGGVTPNATLSDPFPQGITAAPGRAPNINNYFNGLSLAVEIPNNPYGYVQQWNLDIQRQFPGNMLLDVAYAGAKGTHLPIAGFQINQLPVQYMSLGKQLFNQVSNPFAKVQPALNGTLSGPTISYGQSLLPYPEYASLSIAPWNMGASNYNSLQIKAQKNFSGGGTILGVFTASKNLNDGAETQTAWLDGTPALQNYYNLAGEYSLSAFDVSHRMVVSYVLNLPVGAGQKYLSSVHGVLGHAISGWGSDAIWTVQSGFPLFFRTSSNVTGSINGGSRPNFSFGTCPNKGALGGSTDAKVAEWFKTSCFSQPAPFTFGNYNRTSPNLRTGGTDTVDAALFKNMDMLGKERLNVQFRVEAFNLFNTPVFAGPNTTLGAAAFGRVSAQANNPRLIQLAIKLSF